MSSELAKVTTEDLESFQRWLRFAESRYASNRGMRDRPEGLSSDHARKTSGAVAIGRELRESVPLALAALVVYWEAEDDPLAFLSAWVGPSQRAAEAVTLLENDRRTVEQYAVLGLWCQNDECGRFIRPIAMRRFSAPGHSFATTAVCGRSSCQTVTVIWAGQLNMYVCVGTGLEGRNHPMRPYDIYEWLKTQQPVSKQEARLIAL